MKRSRFILAGRIFAYIALAVAVLLPGLLYSAPSSDRALELEEMRTEKRVALVIGNANYASSPLKNPVNDARLMAKTLEGLGFEVIKLENGTLRQMTEKVSEFGKKIRGGGVGLFYYAGHGIAVGGNNYLIPIGANIEVEGDVPLESMDIARVLTRMDEAGNRLNIAILDACRNNPYSRSFRSTEKGLATFDAPKGTFIAYATAPGSVAADGEGTGNGVFTAELAEEIKADGVEIDMVFRQVRGGVMKATEDKQVPWTSSSMTGQFYFKLPKADLVAGGSIEVEKVAPVVKGGGDGGKGELTVRSVPAGAKLYINGEYKGETPLKLTAPEGAYEVKVTQAGYLDQSEKVNVRAGGAKELTLVMDKATGRLQITSTPPGAKVYIDDGFEGITPIGIDIPPRIYAIRVELEGYRTDSRKVVIARNQINDIAVELDKPGGTIFLTSNVEGAKVTYTGSPISFGGPQKDPIKGEAVITDGRSNIKGLNPGSYQITVHAEGYEDFSTKVSINMASFERVYAKLELKTNEVPGMVYVKGGCFQMGDVFGDGKSDEKPVREVCVDDLYIGKYEVTQGEWKAVMGSNPSKFSSCGDNCPVEQVSWNDVQEYIRRLNTKLGVNKYRLPTEAEWEYAARSGGKRERYAGGDNVDAVAWYDGNSGGKTHPVGQKAPNGLGLYDMSGNVWEWVSDWYGDGYYGKSPRSNPKGPDSGDYRVLRGGSWYGGASYARVANRGGYSPGRWNDSLGLRLARTP